MHMQSRKDLNLAEMETVRVCRNPSTVIEANGEVQTNEEATVCVHNLTLFVTVHFLEHACSPIAGENSAKNTDIQISGPVIRYTLHPKNGKLRDPPETKHKKYGQSS